MVTEAKGDVVALDSSKTTLGDHGAQLPVGSLSGSRDMIVRPWRMKEERELGALRDKMKKAPLGEFVAAVVGAMYVRLADVDLDKLKDNERLAAVCRMPMGDVFYAYTWLRREAMGTALDLVVKCPDCGFDTKLTADLDDVDVRTAKPDKTWTFALSAPTTIRGTPATAFRLGLVPWEFMRRAAGSANIGKAKAEIMRAALRQIDDRPPFPLSVDDLDELRKLDIEGLSKSIDENEAGPDFAIEQRCGSCQSLVRTSIDWGFDAFFSKRSSR